MCKGAKRRRAVLCSILAAVLLASCAPGPIGDPDVIRSKETRDTAPSVADADLAELVRGNNAFALDLYHAWRERGGNLFYSPYSVSVALAMTYAGARGETEQQMKEALHFTLEQEALHAALNALDQELARRAQGAREETGTPFELNIANSIWGQEGYEFLDRFLDLLAQNYGAGLRLTDFVKDPEGSRRAVNDWVSEETKDRIKDLIPQGVIDSLTRLVLANAIYFKASWAHPFDESLTQDAPFYLLDADPVDVRMMSMDKAKGLRYVRGNGYQAVELPYVGNAVVMTVIMPDTGTFANFEMGLDAAKLSVIVDELRPEQVLLRLPKFSFEANYGMGDTLAELGMPDAVGMRADFSGMDGTKDLFISEVLHKAFVAVDEAGTEAAAATAVVMGLKMAPPVKPLELTIDRPFVFVIHDLMTNTTLFVGRVLDPTA